MMTKSLLLISREEIQKKNKDHSPAPINKLLSAIISRSVKLSPVSGSVAAMTKLMMFSFVLAVCLSGGEDLLTLDPALSVAAAPLPSTFFLLKSFSMSTALLRPKLSKRDRSRKYPVISHRLRFHQASGCFANSSGHCPASCWPQAKRSSANLTNRTEVSCNILKDRPKARSDTISKVVYESRTVISLVVDQVPLLVYTAEAEDEGTVSSRVSIAADPGLFVSFNKSVHSSSTCCKIVGSAARKDASENP